MEKVIERKIVGGLFGLKNGTKQPSDVAPWLNKLKLLNLPLYEQFFDQYKEILTKFQTIEERADNEIKKLQEN